MSERYSVMWREHPDGTRTWHLHDNKKDENSGHNLKHEGWAIALAECWNKDEELSYLRSTLAAKEAELEKVRKDRDEWKGKAEVARHDFMCIRTQTLTGKSPMEREACAMASEAANRTAEWAPPQSETLSYKIRAEQAERELESERARSANLSMFCQRLEAHRLGALDRSLDFNLEQELSDALAARSHPAKCDDKPAVKSIREVAREHGIEPVEQKQPIPGWPRGPFEDDSKPGREEARSAVIEAAKEAHRNWCEFFDERGKNLVPNLTAALSRLSEIEGK